jgi:hypothetical protein
MGNNSITVIIVLILVTAGGYFYINNAKGDLGGCDITAEEKCNMLSGSEKECCLSSLNEARENEWVVLGPDCCWVEDLSLCADVSCSGDYNIISAQCKGSLDFCYWE